MTTHDSQLDGVLGFVESLCGDSNIRIEEDYGSGFVKLKSSEAEKRQAAQDIRSSEDIVIELLRNARDAGAENIFLALSRSDDMRKIVILDDGCGIPDDMQARVFEPRVTSKLDSAHLDKWGMHGRGMALFSIRENARSADVSFSSQGRGTSMTIVTDTSILPEKADQSSFPSMKREDGKLKVLGAKNILRVAAEFVLEHGDIDLYVGTQTEIAASLYSHGMRSVSARTRSFGSEEAAKHDILMSLSFSATPKELVERAKMLGLDVSERSARRIMDGDIEGALDIRRQLEASVRTCLSDEDPIPDASASDDGRAHRAVDRSPHQRTSAFKIPESDLNALVSAALREYDALAGRYYLSEDPIVKVRSKKGRISIEIDFENTTQ